MKRREEGKVEEDIKEEGRKQKVMKEERCIKGGGKVGDG